MVPRLAGNDRPKDSVTDAIHSEHDRTVRQVFIAIRRDPVRHLLRRWNWKTGLISLGWRGTIFLVANLSAGIKAGLGALLIEVCYRPLLSGYLSAVIQALRFANPGWLAAAVVAIVLPAISHLFELVVHSLCGTANLGTSIAASVAFTVVSSVVELVAMRNGLLLVGTRGESLRMDFHAANWARWLRQIGRAHV